MKDEVGNLIAAVHGVYVDDELTKADRAEILRDVFDDYAARTGRDGLADIRATRTSPEVTKAVDVAALAMAALQGAGAAIRKAHPELSEQQAFARACERHPDVLNIERHASLMKLAKGSSAQDVRSPQVEALVEKRDDALLEMRKRAADLRKIRPELSEQQAFAKVYSAYPALAARERQASRELLFAI